MRTTVVITALFSLLISAVFLFLAEYRRVRRSNSLHDAVFHGHVAWVEKLLDSGVLVDQINEESVFGFRIRAYPYECENGVTPLYVAACESDLKLIRLLLSHGADVNHPVKSPYTILQRAVTQLFPSVDIHGTGLPLEAPDEIKLQIIQLLVDAGADVYAKKYEGAETAIEMCDRMELPEVKQILESTKAPSSLETQTSD
jgi:ankyrin repeat protein